ncbi:MAG TPA: YkvA family protein [Candidatus Binatia bacterium]
MKTFGWNRAVGTAERLVADARKLSGVVEEAIKKLDAHSEALRGVLGDLQLIFRLVRAWIKGEYRDVSKQALLVLIGALVYFLMPIDAIPDVIPGIGLMDDVTVIGMAMAAAKSEIEKFKAWEIKR